MPPSRPQCRGRCGTRAASPASLCCTFKSLLSENFLSHLSQVKFFSSWWTFSHFTQWPWPEEVHYLSDSHLMLELACCLPPARVSFSRTTWKHAKIFCLAFRNICVFYRHLSVHVRSCRRTNCWMLCYATPPDVWQLSEGGELSLSLRSYLKWQNQN